MHNGHINYSDRTPLVQFRAQYVPNHIFALVWADFGSFWRILAYVGVETPFWAFILLLVKLMGIIQKGDHVIEGHYVIDNLVV